MMLMRSNMRLPFFIMLLFFISTGAQEKEVVEAKKNIQKHVKELYQPLQGSLCGSYSCCNISDTESCSLNDMPKDESTLVLPGGETTCIYTSSTPFAFQVIPGDKDKVVIYFQGGGACWDRLSTIGGFCTTDASPQSLVGLFDRKKMNNKFKDYTIIHALYCSGDVWGGNVTRSYTDLKGEPVIQHGLANAQAVLDWTLKQQKRGILTSTLSQLVVMGCSAGSIGAQLWGKTIVETLSWKYAAVVPDSYAGVFPEGSMGPLIYGYGFCDSGFLSGELYKKCEAQELTLMDIDMELIASTPTVPYTFIQSKTDIVQQSFYIALGITTNASQKLVDPTRFYDAVQEIFEGYNHLENFAVYLVDGYQHCFTPMNVYYTADGEGPRDDGKNTDGFPMLYEWVNKLPLVTGDQISTVCQGEIEEDAAKVKATPTGRNDYCPAELLPKTITGN